jgi:hypothetical protein
MKRKDKKVSTLVQIRNMVDGTIYSQVRKQVRDQADYQILNQVKVDVYSQLEDAMNAGEDDNIIYVSMIEDQIIETID